MLWAAISVSQIQKKPTQPDTFAKKSENTWETCLELPLNNPFFCSLTAAEMSRIDPRRDHREELAPPGFGGSFFFVSC